MNVGHAHPRQLFFGVAEHAAQGRVGLAELHRLHVGDEDSLRSAIEQRLVVGFRLLARGDIADEIQGRRLTLPQHLQDGQFRVGHIVEFALHSV